MIGRVVKSERVIWSSLSWLPDNTPYEYVEYAYTIILQSMWCNSAYIE